MYTEEVRVSLAPPPRTDSVKPLSRVNPMRHAAGGSPLHFFFSGGMLVNLFFLFGSALGGRITSGSVFFNVEQAFCLGKGV